MEEEGELQCDSREGLSQTHGAVGASWSFIDVPSWGEESGLLRPDVDQLLSVDSIHLDPLPSWKFPKRADS